MVGYCGLRRPTPELILRLTNGSVGENRDLHADGPFVADSASSSMSTKWPMAGIHECRIRQRQLLSCRPHQRAFDQQAGPLPGFGISGNDLLSKYAVQDRGITVRIEGTPEIESVRVRTIGV